MTAELVALVCEVCGAPNYKMMVYDRRRGWTARN
jgi:hypothetical protein